MAKYSLTKFQVYSLRWLKIFAVICLFVSLWIFKVPRHSQINVMTDYDLFAFLLPFVHFGIWSLIWAGNFLMNIGDMKTSVYSSYIKENYPKLWKNLHPWGDLSHGVGGFSFIFGNPEKETDDILNSIRFHERIRLKLLIYPFLIVIFIWALNLTIVLLKTMR